MTKLIRTFLLLAASGPLFGLAQQEPAPKLEVELASTRLTVVVFQPLEVKLTVRNAGTAPSGSIERSALVRENCVVAAGAYGPDGRRLGKWAPLVGAPPTGAIGALSPGESFTIPFQVTLPGEAVVDAAQVAIQWIGGAGTLFDGLRSAELPLNISPVASPLATLTTTEGRIVVELWPSKAPNHVANLIELAEAGFYKDILFHRVVPGFVIQAGCPEGTGQGGPGYRIAAEFNASPFKKGTLGMARGSDNDSAGSQFFICVADRQDLDRNYTAFGAVIEGQDIADRISMMPTAPGSSRPVRDVLLQSVTIDLPPGFEKKPVVKVSEDKK